MSSTVSNPHPSIFICNRLVFAITATLVGILAADHSLAQGRFTTIFHQGDSAGGNGEFFRIKSDPTINNLGQVTFTAELQNTAGGTSDNEALWLYDGGSLTELLRLGDTLDGEEIGLLGFGISPTINDNGQICFRAQFSDAETQGGLSPALYIYDQNEMHQIVRLGDAAGDGQHGFFYHFEFNNAGQIAFSSNEMLNTNSGTDNDEGLFFYDGNSITEQMREGDPYMEGAFKSIRQIFQLNDVGQTAFLGYIELVEDGETIVRSSLFVAEGNQYQEFARDGAQSNKGQIGELRYGARINNNGKLAFPDDFAVFTADGNEIVEIARIGDQTDKGLVGENPFIYGFNDNDQILFETDIVNPPSNGLNNEAMFLFDGSDLIEIGRTGDVVSDGKIDGFVRANINENGQAVVQRLLYDTSTHPNNSITDVIITDGIEKIEVIRTGDIVDGKANIDVISESINDHGQIPIVVRFADGSHSLQIFTPDLRWRSSDSGNWSDAKNWTLSIQPHTVHDVFINPDVDLSVSANTNAFARSLQIGGGSGNASLNLQNGSTIFTEYGVNINSNGTLRGHGIIDGDVDNNGFVIADLMSVTGVFRNNGVLQIDQSSNGSLIVYDEYTGANGHIGGGDLFVLGLLNPGNSIGQLQFDGNLLLGEDSMTLIEISGLLNGEFDQLYVASDFHVDGQIDVRLINNFDLSLNDMFLVAQVDGNISGQFSGIEEGGLIRRFGDIRLRITYQAGDGNDIAFYAAIPEPSTALLISLSLAFAAQLHRKRK